jgi:hypothetical protein
MKDIKDLLLVIFFSIIPGGVHAFMLDRIAQQIVDSATDSTKEK